MDDTETQARTRQLQARLEECEALIALLNYRMQLGAGGELEHSRQAYLVGEKLKSLGSAVESAAASGHEGLEELRAGVQRAWNELRGAFELAGTRF